MRTVANAGHVQLRGYPRVHADYPTSGAGTLRVDTDMPARATVPELGIDVPGRRGRGGRRVLERELPGLYDADVANAGERVRLRIGFRTVMVEDGLLKVNSQGVDLRRWPIAPEDRTTCARRGAPPDQ